MAVGWVRLWPSPRVVALNGLSPHQPTLYEAGLGRVGPKSLKQGPGPWVVVLGLAVVSSLVLLKLACFVMLFLKNVTQAWPTAHDFVLVPCFFGSGRASGHNHLYRHPHAKNGISSGQGSNPNKTSNIAQQQPRKMQH